MLTLTTAGPIRRRAHALAIRGVREWLHREDRAPRHMSIMVVDVTGFGRLDNRAQTRVRTALNTMVRGAFRRAGIRWSIAVENRGDGMIVLVPPTKSTVSLLDPVVPALAALVRRHNGTAEPRIRLRVSVHLGVVGRDANGWVGSDLITACRLVDSPAVRRYFQLRPAEDLVVAVSDLVYRGIVAHRYRGLDPAAYDPVHVSVKELRTLAWLHVPSPEP